MGWYVYSLFCCRSPSRPSYLATSTIIELSVSTCKPFSLTLRPGFYTLDPSKPRQLILGPFQGGVACQTIAFTRGVCGYAATHATIQVVNDVAAFPNHIACDSASKSELVVPIVVDGEVKAVIDVDCAVEAGFDEEDALFVNELAELLGKGCDW